MCRFLATEVWIKSSDLFGVLVWPWLSFTRGTQGLKMMKADTTLLNCEAPVLVRQNYKCLVFVFFHTLSKTYYSW